MCSSNGFTGHDQCNKCGIKSDGLMTCTYNHSDETIQLCPHCITDSGFCYGCGRYSAGIESFDFSDMPNYCAECQGELQDLFIQENIEMINGSNPFEFSDN